MEHTNNGADAPRALAEALEALDRTLKEERADLAALRERHLAALGQLKSERAHEHDLAWELEELEHHLRDLLAQREGPPDRLLEREIASLMMRRAAVEESALKQMLEIDELAARCAAAEQALAEREREWAARESLLMAERERIAGLIEQGNG